MLGLSHTPSPSILDEIYSDTPEVKAARAENWLYQARAELASITDWSASYTMKSEADLRWMRRQSMITHHIGAARQSLSEARSAIDALRKSGADQDTSTADRLEFTHRELTATLATLESSPLAG